MKTIGVLFDVSGSMKNKFNNIKNSEKVNKKSDELINILKKLGKNMNTNIFTILFGLQDSPYIIDFIKLLQISNKKFRKITSTEETEKNPSITIYRDKLIDLLSKDQNGNERYCNIREYVISEAGPKERLSEFFCNLMEDNREIIDNIYDNLPKEVKYEDENQNLDNRIKKGKMAANVGGGVLGWFGIKIAAPVILVPLCVAFPPLTGALPYAGLCIDAEGGYLGNRLLNNYADNKIDNSKKEETINAIKNSFKSSIEIITKKIINEYKLINHQNYELIKGENILQLIDDMEKKLFNLKKIKIFL